MTVLGIVVALAGLGAFWWAGTDRTLKLGEAAILAGTSPLIVFGGLALVLR